MKKLSLELLSNTIINKRKAMKLSQQELASMTGINRTMIGRLESLDYYPSIPQLESLSEVLDLEPTDFYINEESMSPVSIQSKNIAVAGTGYVGLSLAVLLAGTNNVTAVDIVPERVEMINHKKSPIQDDYIEDYLSNKSLNLTATTNAKEAYKKLII